MKKVKFLLKCIFALIICYTVHFGNALAELGYAVHQEKGYSVCAYTVVFSDDANLKLDAIVQYDPSFVSQDRIETFELYINGKRSAQLEKITKKKKQGELEYRALYRLWGYESNEKIDSIDLVPVWTKAGTSVDEYVHLKPGWDQVFSEMTAYVQNNNGTFAPIYQSPACNHMIGKLYNGTRLQIMELDSPDGWAAVHQLKSVGGELYGYVEKRYLTVLNEKNERNLNFTQQIVDIKQGTQLFDVHDCNQISHVFDTDEKGVVLGEIHDDVLVSTSHGIGCIHSFDCTLAFSVSKRTYLRFGRSNSLFNIEVFPDANDSVQISAHIIYPTWYTVNDDIDTFAVYVNNNRQEDLIDADPFDYYNGKYQITNGENVITLVPIWFKAGEVRIDDDDAVKISF